MLGENVPEAKLKWLIKNTRKGDKLYLTYYISVPSKIALFLEGTEPYFDVEKRAIIFRPKEK